MRPYFINTMATTAIRLRHLYTFLSPHLTIARISIQKHTKNWGSAPSFKALRHSRGCPAPTVQELGTYYIYLLTLLFLYIDAIYVIIYDTPYPRVNEGVNVFL